MTPRDRQDEQEREPFWPQIDRLQRSVEGGEVEVVVVEEEGEGEDRVVKVDMAGYVIYICIYIYLE